MGGLDLLARDTSPGASRWWRASLTVRATLARGVGGRGLPLCSPSALSRGQHSSLRPPWGVGGQCRSRGEGGLPAAPWPEPEPRLHVKGHVLPAWATTRMGLGITLPSESRRSKTKASRRHSCDARNPRTERNRLTKDRLTDIVDNLVGRGRGWGLGEWGEGSEKYGHGVGSTAEGTRSAVTCRLGGGPGGTEQPGAAFHKLCTRLTKAPHTQN